MVSGSDMHGTPITLKADQENKTPEQIATHYHDIFVDIFKKLGIRSIFILIPILLTISK